MELGCSPDRTGYPPPPKQIHKDSVRVGGMSLAVTHEDSFVSLILVLYWNKNLWLEQQSNLINVEISEVRCIFIILCYLFVYFGSPQILREIGWNEMVNGITDTKIYRKFCSVLLRERKRRTDCSISSIPYAVLSGGVPTLAGGGVGTLGYPLPPVWTDWKYYFPHPSDAVGNHPNTRSHLPLAIPAFQVYFEFLSFPIAS